LGYGKDEAPFVQAVRNVWLFTPMTFLPPDAVVSNAMSGYIGSPIGSGLGSISTAKTSL